ncbi:hypothetical protein KD050_07395 [Psychrobacillus sp. INOP01]|uniref:hypothetical protein n=1 Tax=Psychrobacillus sp. INOP01 TaxID=2829187 RepID=UPI001BACE536|nr:hypothetical protein [Psychrobacillus sp. INOP01]QUG43054.1 hypothetical protein KD050_07395 [Psychrobacillus sp. INOP01]
MKWIFILISAMVLAACSDSKPSISKEVTVDNKQTQVSESSEEIDVIEPVTEVSELTPLTLDDFNNRYELDTEYSEPFINGKFELKDGSIVYADWYFYLEGETFDYATGTFIDGQLVQAQLELKDGVSNDDMLSELGLSKEIDYELNKKTNIIDVVIDERFDDANISRLPNEWD